MPNCSLINLTTRGEVHRLVRNPNAVGSFRSQEQTVRSWAAESLDAGPGCLTAARPASPRPRYQVIQLLTLRTETFSEAATAACVSPSRTRCTARRRRSSRPGASVTRRTRTGTGVVLIPHGRGPNPSGSNGLKTIPGIEILPDVDR